MAFWKKKKSEESQGSYHTGVRDREREKVINSKNKGFPRMFIFSGFY
jgi:hypothetical protein